MNCVITTAEKIRRLEVELAYARGQKIQYDWICNPPERPGWVDIYPNHVHLTQPFDWINFRYRLTPTSPLAAGHNPDKLTEEQVGVKDGWRLLAPEEIGKATDKQLKKWPISGWEKGKWDIGYCGFILDTTYRTKAPIGFYLQPATRPLTARDWDKYPIVWVKHKENQCNTAYLVFCVEDECFAFNPVSDETIEWDDSEQTSQYLWSPDRIDWRPFTVEC